MATGKPYSGPTDSPFTPDADTIRRQLEFWFAGSLLGTLEVGWYDRYGGELTKFERFDLTDIDEAARFIVERNSVPGQSIYFRPALIKKTAPKYLDDTHFVETPGPWCDLDGEGAADNARTIYSLCRPNMAVVTGRKPHKRAQLFWRQEDMLRDGPQLKQLNIRICDTLRGDRKVVNPTSLMRLAGTIAWPRKPGREIELTELVLFDDDRPKSYPAGAIDKAFPETAHQQQSSSRPNFSFDPDDGERFEEAAQQAKPNFEREGLSPVELLKKIHAGEEWHNNALVLVGHWISRGWCDAEILAASVSFTLPGYTWQDTINDVAGMIRSGREKWNTPNPEHDVNLGDEFAAKKALEPTPAWNIDPAAITRRQWILGTTALAKALTVLVAPPGVGKSTVTIVMGVSVAAGIPIAGIPVITSGAVWIYNNEDDRDEMHRRIAAVLQHFKIDPKTLTDRLYADSGDTRPLMVATKDKKGNVIQLPDVEAIIARIIGKKIKLLIVDPFVETHTADENDNQQMKAVAGLFRTIAQRTGCAVILVHHTRKLPIAGSEGFAGSMDAGRGAGSVAGVARIFQTLFAMSPKDAETYGISDKERRLYIRLDDAKGNMALVSDEALWYRRTGVDLPNGDQVGVLVPVDLSASREQAAADRAHTLAHAVAACLRNGEAKTSNALAREMRSRDLSTMSERRLADRIREEIGHADAPTEVDMGGQKIQLWRFTEGSHETAPICIRRQDVR